MDRELPGARHLIWEVLAGPLGPQPRCSLYRKAVLVALLLVLLPWQAVTLLALAVDRLLFPQFERIPVERPMFIVGPPRSGTTLLHRLISLDEEQFTTFRLWELLFAPAICQKLFWRKVADCDERLGRPFGRCFGWIASRLAGSFDRLHPTSLSAPEEDYLSLLPFGGCFLLVVAIPHEAAIWKLGRFDEAYHATTRHRILRQYRRMIQRHLFVFGSSRTFLSKNPSFSSWIESLGDEFPDASFVCTWRSLDATLPSQLSSIQSATRWLGNDAYDARLIKRFLDLFVYYYHHSSLALRRFPRHRIRQIDYGEMIRDPAGSVMTVMSHLGYGAGELFGERLVRAARQTQTYRSRHQYDLSDIGFTHEQLEREACRALLRMGAHMERPAALLFTGRKSERDSGTFDTSSRR